MGAADTETGGARSVGELAQPINSSTHKLSSADGRIESGTLRCDGRARKRHPEGCLQVQQEPTSQKVCAMPTVNAFSCAKKLLL